uniref:Uncharacterized protein n=1 Tax=Plectus sambesii TaxID=2011161 RepID=A0A914WAI6_9BILA
MVKIWSNGYQIKDFGIQCEASPYCEMIQYYLCWDLIGNPQYVPKWMLSVIFGLLYLGSWTVYLIYVGNYLNPEYLQRQASLRQRSKKNLTRNGMT